MRGWGDNGSQTAQSARVTLAWIVALLALGLVLAWAGGR